MSEADDGYETGYRKPPRHSQFKPGQSGNPRGRNKGSRGLKSDLAAELEAKQTIQINKKPITNTRQRLLIMTLATRAAAGDLKAASVLLPLIVQVLGIEDRGNDRPGKLSAQDQAILDELLGCDDTPAAQEVELIASDDPAENDDV